MLTAIALIVAALILAAGLLRSAVVVGRGLETLAHQMNRVSNGLRVVGWGVRALRPVDEPSAPTEPIKPNERERQFGLALAWLTAQRMDPAREEECRLAIERVFGLRQDEISEAEAVKLLHRHGVPDEVWRAE